MQKAELESASGVAIVTPRQDIVIMNSITGTNFVEGE